MIQSIAQRRGQVCFPSFEGERIYMQPFFQKDGLPSSMGRWQATVDSMLDGIKTDNPIYLMVDQGIVLPSKTHRRPGVHVDGYWNPGTGRHGSHSSISAHGGNGGHGGRRQEPESTHSGRRGHSARQPDPEIRPGHKPAAPGHRPRRGASGWEDIDFSAPEAIILASDVSACAAYVGEYDEHLLGHGGDATGIDLSGLDMRIFDAGIVHAGNVGMLHESIPLHIETRRTLVRLNVPGWTP